MMMNAVFAADAEIGSDAVFAADFGLGSDAAFTIDKPNKDKDTPKPTPKQPISLDG